jgi:hypothetical protein
MEGRRAERRGKKGWKMKNLFMNYDCRRQIEKVKGVRGQERRGLWARRPQTVHLEGRLGKVRGKWKRQEDCGGGVCVGVFVCV